MGKVSSSLGSLEGKATCSRAQAHRFVPFPSLPFLSLFALVHHLPSSLSPSIQSLRHRWRLPLDRSSSSSSLLGHSFEFREQGQFVVRFSPPSFLLPLTNVPFSPALTFHKVWISESNLHLIPLSVSSPISTRPPKHERRLNLNGGDHDSDDEGTSGGDGGGDGWLSRQKALEEVREGRWRDLGVEREVWERIAG